MRLVRWSGGVVEFGSEIDQVITFGIEDGWLEGFRNEGGLVWYKGQ